MPTYEIRCKGCHRRDIIYRTVEARDQNLPYCPACKSETERVISKPMVIPDLAPYQSPNGGHWVNSRAQRKEDLTRSGAIAWEPGIEKDIARQKEYEQEKAFKPLGDAVDRIVTEMNVAGRLETDNG